MIFLLFKTARMSELLLPFSSCVPNGQYLQIVVGKNSCYVLYSFMWVCFGGGLLDQVTVSEIRNM